MGKRISKKEKIHIVILIFLLVGSIIAGILKTSTSTTREIGISWTHKQK
tara:strand:+ start:306 stop:452 length:147 start_codon:yes stop_codon:yes gene_type:complete